MIVLDTTVLVYATGGDHPMRAPSRAIMTALAGDTLRATTSVEVIQEFAHVPLDDTTMTRLRAD